MIRVRDEQFHRGWRMKEATGSTARTDVPFTAHCVCVCEGGWDREHASARAYAVLFFFFCFSFLYFL